MKDHISESAVHLAQDAARVAPPVAVSGLTLSGVPISEWLILVTLIYTLLQIVFSSIRFYKEHKKEQESEDERDGQDGQ
jgi:hypothetical protein